MKSIKAIFRRGQTSTKLDGQIHTPEDLSRSSSVTNLNAEQTSPKTKSGATKPRKSSSRDRLDKIAPGTGTAERKNDRKGINRNNNKLESGDQSLTLDSLQELESLKTQLHQMATEKSSLALKLGEQKGQIHSLQHQIENFKMYQEQSSLQLEQLTEENTALRNRLRDVAHSPLSDNEKQQLLYESHRHHNSAPASIATNHMEDGTCGDVTACPTPDWDKHSSGNVSEVSVACLQDKINQMQETHYSTNEELQATLQELTDLQRQLTELQQENERLGEEKNLMFDSLCRQTERLKDTRQEVESLKTLLYREKNETGLESAQEREEKLVDLLKSAQDEHESLLSKHEQLSAELQELREANDALHDQLKVLAERNGTLESTLDAKQAEHKLLDQELTQARDQCNGKQIEVNRLKDLLENARTKIIELEQDRALGDKSELDEMLDNARKEKDALESEVAHLKEQLARSKNEIEKLKEQVSILQEECKVTRNNARTIQSDLEYKYEKLASEKVALTEQLHKFQDIINELQVQAQCQEEDKRNLSDVLAETQRNLSESERRISMLENELVDVKRLRREENEEWEKFQNDLLTSVRVANDFKTEAQQDLQKMIMENKEHRDKVRLLEAQLDKLKGDPAMTDERRNSQPYPKQVGQKRIFGSLPNLLDAFGEGPKRPPKWMRHQKKLSQGEEKILESLHKMYHEIDPKKPDEMLTSEQAVVKKLKILYEDDSTAYKPVAPRNKHDLAISKPLLESVYSNPKLKSIAGNPNLRSLEKDRFSWMGHKLFSDDAKKKSDGRFMSYLPEAPPSRESSKRFPLRRYSSKEDLTGIAELDSFKDPMGGKRSSLKCGHSDTSSNTSHKKRVSFDEQRNSCVVIKDFLSFGSLEDIYKKIDPKLPEDQLTKEQRFALRLKTSMENLGEKPELRKRPTFKKTRVTISSPLKASVLKNTKLLSIIKDPVVRTAGEDTELETVELRKVHRMKKYLGDVNRVLRDPKCSRLSKSLEDLRGLPYVFQRISSSMENLPSEGVEPKVEIMVVTRVLPAKAFAASFNVSSSSSSVEETPVVFLEHFESEKVQIQDVSEDVGGEDDDENTGRVSFPEEEVCRMRLLSINSVEMEEEDDVLARYRRISEYIEEASDKESNVDPKREDDSQSFYSVELTNAADDTVQTESSVPPEDDWLGDYLDQTCDLDERKETRKMRVLYKNVVQEIKRRYSPSESSDDEEAVHIFDAKEGKVEVRRPGDDEDFEDNVDANFFDRFFKTNRSFLPESGEDKSSLDHPTEDEMDYIKKVREEYKDEFEDLDRLGCTDVESETFLRRQNALDFEDSKCSPSPETAVLTTNEWKLLSSIEKRHSTLSDINMADITFIESMKDKYLWRDNFKATDVPQKDPSTSYSNYYLKFLTECFLEKEINHKPDQRPSYSSKLSTSYSDYYLKCLTENFLENEIQQGEGVSPFQGRVLSEGVEEQDFNPEATRPSTSYSDYYLKYSTSHFLKEEINHNTSSKEPTPIRREDPPSGVGTESRRSWKESSGSKVGTKDGLEASDQGRDIAERLEFFSNKEFILEGNKEPASIRREDPPPSGVGVKLGRNSEESPGTKVGTKDASEAPGQRRYIAKRLEFLSNEELILEGKKEPASILREDPLSSGIGVKLRRSSKESSGSKIGTKDGSEAPYQRRDVAERLEFLSNKELQLEGKKEPVSIQREDPPPSGVGVKFGRNSEESSETKEETKDASEAPGQRRYIAKRLEFLSNKELLLEGKKEPVSIQREDLPPSDVGVKFGRNSEESSGTMVETKDASEASGQRRYIAKRLEFLSNDELILEAKKEPASIRREDPPSSGIGVKLRRSSKEYSGSKVGTEDASDLRREVAERPEFVSNKELILRNPREKSSRISSSCSSWLYYEPVYANSIALHRPTPINLQVKPKKPKPLPRKASIDSRSNITTIEVNPDSVPRLGVVKVKNEAHEELLPNSSKVMDASEDVVRKTTKPDKVQDCSSGESSVEPPDKFEYSGGSSNVMVKKTKKFIKEGDVVEEFDEATGVYNFRLDNLPDDDKFDLKSQIIPDTLVDYADSESKVTLFDGFSDFQESCSRPQTSRQRSTPFRLSYYGESSEEVDGLEEATSRTSVSRLKQKFENLTIENDEPERNSVVVKEFKDAQKANLAKLLNEKAAYDLVFKTDSKYWFDNTSEAEKTVEPSSSQKPLNITILDPIESKTNANYQHLFEGGQKPVVDNVKLSEMNLKTSIPCVDFTTMNNPMVERESNASLYNFGLGSEGSSGVDAATFVGKDQ